jgi:hypothetical protein
VQHRLLSIGCGIALLALFGDPPAAAQGLEPAASSDEGGVSGRVSIGFGASKIAEDWFGTLTPALTLTIPNLTLARQGDLFDRDQTHDLRLRFSAPLRFRLKDRAPTDNEGAFRRRDWDEPAEFMRILRGVEYGAPYAGIYVRGGELVDVRIGHRTIVDAYDNAIDVDHFQWGLHSALNTTYGGTELLFDNLADPELMGIRLYARPVAFADRTSYWSRFAVGTSLIGDRDAPLQLAYTAQGTGYQIDGDGDFVELSSRATGLWGVDVEMAFDAGERVTITPYSDANVHLGSGAGWHLGTFFGFQLSEQVVMDVRAEYRLLGNGYLPGYFGPLYEVERWSYLPVLAGSPRVPKWQYLRSSFLGRRSGYLGEIGLNIANRVFLSGTWEDARGPDNNAAWIQVRVPALKVLQFGALWANTRFNAARGLFDPENALATAEVRVSLLKWLYLDAQANRRWQLQDDGDGEGAYRPVDDFAFGVGATFGF